MEYVLGIDQGGTKTQAVIADENGVILGLGQSGGACHSVHGMEQAMNKIDEAVKAAMKQSKIHLFQIRVLYAGMTGLDWDYEKTLLTETLKTKFNIPQTYVVNDCIVALRAGTEKENGSILCAGTGLNCAVRKDKDHEIVYGYYIPDEYQGGSALGEKAIRAVLDAETGIGEKTLLTELLFGYFGVNSADELLYKKVNGQIHSEEKNRLPLLIEKAADQNDGVALQILNQYGRHIAHYVTAGMKKLGILDGEMDVILSGSIFKCKLPVLREAVSSEIHCHAAHASVINSRFEPIVGSLLLALEDLHQKKISKQIYQNIERSAENYPIIRTDD